MTYLEIKQHSGSIDYLHQRDKHNFRFDELRSESAILVRAIADTILVSTNSVANVRIAMLIRTTCETLPLNLRLENTEFIDVLSSPLDPILFVYGNKLDIATRLCRMPLSNPVTYFYLCIYRW